MKASKPIRNFFPNINHHFILNTLQVSLFMLKIPQHKERLKEILQITNPEISIADFSKIVQLEIDTFENALVDEPQVLMREITTGSAIKVIKDTPVVWCFIALYWGYHFKDQDEASILKVYDSRIGDVALKFLLYFLKMKQKEISMPDEPAHKDSFYSDLAARLVRIVDVLSSMAHIDSLHLMKVYFPKDAHDLALNFLNAQITYPWCADTLTVVKDRKTGKNVIQYADEDHDILFYTLPSRMTKAGVFNDLDKTYLHLMQLYNLDSANKKTPYSLVHKNETTSFSVKKMKKPEPIVDAFTAQLIYDTHTPSMSSHYLEEKEEIKLTSRTYRRAIKSDYDPHSENSEHENDSERSIPNAFVQHKRNKAFSSSRCKDNLNLKSDYDIPLLEHLKSFIDFLGASMLNLNQLYIGFFILCVVLGSKAEDILNLLRGDSDTSLGFKNGVLTVRIDDKPFAKKINSDFLAKSNDILKFSLPAILSMLINRMKIDFSTSVDMDNEAFLSRYKDFIKESAKTFPKNITIKPEQVNRYLERYIHDMDADALTALLATTMVFRKDRAKAAYVSARSNSEVHAQLLSQYCIDLGLDSVISSLLGIPNVFQTTVSTTSPNNFTGSSRVADPEKARTCFKALRINILKHSNDRELHFNLVTIYIRYAASLLLGTRSFINSANFNSYSSDLGLLYINEKSQDIASGVRVVPVCNTMKSLLEYYGKMLEERGLKHNIYLIDDEEIMLFSAREAFQVVQDAPYLYNQEILEEYIKEVPLNSGRHLFTRKAIDFSISSHYISTYLGHYSAGEEQFGLYSTLNIADYCNSITYITTIIANEFGIKELS